MLLEAGVADLFDIFLRNDPPGAAGARIEGQKIGPRLFELEADMLWVGGFDSRDPVLDQVMGGAAIALERELDVLGGDRLAIVEFDAITQHEVAGQSVLRHRPRLGETWRLDVARHRLHHGVVQRVEHHKRGDQRLRLSRIKPERRERYVEGPGQLALRAGAKADPGAAARPNAVRARASRRVMPLVRSDLRVPATIGK